MKKLLAILILLASVTAANAQLYLGERCLQGFDDLSSGYDYVMQASPGDTITLTSHVRSRKDLAHGYDQIRFLGVGIQVTWCTGKDVVEPNIQCVRIERGRFWTQKQSTKSRLLADGGFTYTYTDSEECRTFVAKAFGLGYFLTSTQCSYSTGNYPNSSEAFVYKLKLDDNLEVSDSRIIIELSDHFAAKVCPSSTEFNEDFYLLQGGPTRIIVMLTSQKTTTENTSFSCVKALY